MTFQTIDISVSILQYKVQDIVSTHVHTSFKTCIKHSNKSWLYWQGSGSWFTVNNNKLIIWLWVWCKIDLSKNKDNSKLIFRNIIIEYSLILKFITNNKTITHWYHIIKIAVDGSNQKEKNIVLIIMYGGITGYYYNTNFS